MRPRGSSATVLFMGVETIYESQAQALGLLFATLASILIYTTKSPARGNVVVDLRQGLLR